MKKNITRKLALVLACVFAIGMIAGCGSSSAAPAASAASSAAAAAESTAAEAASAVESTAAEAASAVESAAAEAETAAAPAEHVDAAPDPNHEVYTMDNRVPWSGLTEPVVASRADVYKGISAENILPDDQVKVGFATHMYNSSFFIASGDEIERLCKEYGYEYVHMDASSDINQHVSDLETMAIDCDVIIDMALVVDAEMPALQAAIDKGIAVIGYGTAFPSDFGMITAADVSYYEQGFETGVYSAQVMDGQPVILGAIPGGTGNIIGESKFNGWLGGFVYERAILMGKPYDSREDAMLAAYNLEQEIVSKGVFDFPELDFTCPISVMGGWTREGGQKAAEDLLVAHPEVNFIYSDNDQQGIGIVNATVAAGLTPGQDLQIVCIGDGMTEALEYVKDGSILAISLASPYEEAGACAELAHMIFHDGFDATNLPASSHLVNVVCNKDNVDEYLGEDEFAHLPKIEFIPIEG